jgi:putative transposase
LLGHLRRALGEYIAYFNRERPHQGRGQRVPVPDGASGPARRDTGVVIASPVLGGLHHAYRRAA